MLVRCTSALALLLGVGLVYPSVALADTTSEAKNTIQQVYKKRDVAAEKKDIQGSLSTISPDFVFVSKDGQTGDAKLLKRRLTPLFALMQSVKSKSEILNFALKGRDAKATVKQHLEMVIVNPQTQAPQKLVADATSEDLWTKTSSGWLQKRMTTKTETAKIDGKSVDDQLSLSGKPGHGAGHTSKKTAKKSG